MTSKTKEELLSIAEEWANDQLEIWIGEYGAWDHLLEDPDTEFSDDDLDWIQNNVKFNINVEEVNYE